LDMRIVSLAIEGMHCGACVRRVTAALEKLDGVEVLKVDIGAAEVRLADPSAGDQRIVDAIERIGFKAKLA
jgi:copper chaperone